MKYCTPCYTGMSTEAAGVQSLCPGHLLHCLEDMAVLCVPGSQQSPSEAPASLIGPESHEGLQEGMRGGLAPRPQGLDQATAPLPILWQN